MPVRVSIVVPTLNEERNLPYVLHRIPKLPEIQEIILVDARSSDNTVEVAKELITEIRVVLQNGKGKGDALMCGGRAASGDYFLVLDGDASMRPEEISHYIEKAEEGYDLVKGSRFMPGGSSEDQTVLRKIIVKTANRIANILWRTNFSDICYGLFLINRQKFLSLDLKSVSFDVEWEMMAKAETRGLKIVEIPSREQARPWGASNVSYFRHGWIIARRVFTETLSRWGKKSGRK